MNFYEMGNEVCCGVRPQRIHKMCLTCPNFDPNPFVCEGCHQETEGPVPMTRLCGPCERDRNEHWLQGMLPEHMRQQKYRGEGAPNGGTQLAGWAA